MDLQPARVHLSGSRDAGPRFALCAPCLAAYQALRRDPAAPTWISYTPLGTLCWDDEHPGQVLPGVRKSCTESCGPSMAWLVMARRAIQRGEPLSEGLARVWDEARRALPSWPGFARLSPSAEELRSIEDAERIAHEGFEALVDSADVATREVRDGLEQFSLTFDLTDPPDE